MDFNIATEKQTMKLTAAPKLEVGPMWGWVFDFYKKEF